MGEVVAVGLDFSSAALGLISGLVGSAPDPVSAALRNLEKDITSRLSVVTQSVMQAQRQLEKSVLGDILSNAEAPLQSLVQLWDATYPHVNDSAIIKSFNQTATPISTYIDQWHFWRTAYHSRILTAP